MTTEIDLGNGRVALIDDEDFDLVVQRTWRYLNTGTGYAIAKSDGRTIYMHRIIMHAPNGMQVDHINDNGLDNQKSNLRLCTQQQNCQHKGLTTRNKSGYKGVSWSNQRNKWRADIKANGVRQWLGWFETPEAAAAAYNSAAEKHFGSFAPSNSSREQQPTHEVAV